MTPVMVLYVFMKIHGTDKKNFYNKFNFLKCTTGRLLQNKTMHVM